MRGFELGVAGKASVDVTTDVETTTGDPVVALIADGTYTIEGNVTDGLKLINGDGVQVGQSEDGLTWTDMAETDATTLFTFTEVVDQGTVKITDGVAAATAYVDNAGLQAGTYTISETDDVLDASGNTLVHGIQRRQQ